MSTCSGVRWRGSLAPYRCATLGMPKARLAAVLPAWKRYRKKFLRCEEAVLSRSGGVRVVRCCREADDVGRGDLRQVADLLAEAELQETVGELPTVEDRPLAEATLTAQIGFVIPTQFRSGAFPWPWADGRFSDTLFIQEPDKASRNEGGRGLAVSRSIPALCHEFQCPGFIKIFEGDLSPPSSARRGCSMQRMYRLTVSSAWPWSMRCCRNRRRWSPDSPGV